MVNVRSLLAALLLGALGGALLALWSAVEQARGEPGESADSWMSNAGKVLNPERLLRGVLSPNGFVNGSLLPKGMPATQRDRQHRDGTS